MKLFDIKLDEAVAPRPQKTANKIHQDWDTMFGSSAPAPKQPQPEPTPKSPETKKPVDVVSGEKPNLPATRTSNDMPSVMATAIQDHEGVVPEWRMVKHLPGYLASGIRSMGQAVFSAFTSTPIEEIQVLANLGDGPNDQSEIDAVVQYLKDSGQRDSEAEITFHEHIPNYGAKVKIYKAIGHTFMVVKDFAGNYVYSWPTKDGDGLSGIPDRPRLK